MGAIIKLTSIAALLLTVIPSVLVAAGHLSLASSKTLMLVGTVAWFVAVPFLGRLAARAPRA